MKREKTKGKGIWQSDKAKSEIVFLFSEWHQYEVNTASTAIQTLFFEGHAITPLCSQDTHTEDILMELIISIFATNLAEYNKYLGSVMYKDIIALKPNIIKMPILIYNI